MRFHNNDTVYVLYSLLLYRREALIPLKISSISWEGNVACSTPYDVDSLLFRARRKRLVKIATNQPHTFALT